MTIQNRPQNLSPESVATRRTVIPNPRTDALFAGWGVKF
jgi:hypothetical protein